ERVKDLDVDGIAASLCFPDFVSGFGGTRFNKLADRELGFACIKAYNDFQIEEWAGRAPGRLYSMILLPYWDPQLAVSELQRAAVLGARAVAFSENPYRQGFPAVHDESGYWNPVFAAAEEAQMPLCLHFGSSSWIFSNTPGSVHITQTVSAPLN